MRALDSGDTADTGDYKEAIAKRKIERMGLRRGIFGFISAELTLPLIHICYVLEKIKHETVSVNIL
jgi:hypothetical protein